jgi:hypothetical protein
MTQKQADERRDFVDNAIHELLIKLSGVEVEWDIEAIGEVRDSVEYGLCVVHQVMSAQDFYPDYTEIEE